MGKDIKSGPRKENSDRTRKEAVYAEPAKEFERLLGNAGGGEEEKGRSWENAETQWSSGKLQIAFNYSEFIINFGNLGSRGQSQKWHIYYRQGKKSINSKEIVWKRDQSRVVTSKLKTKRNQ